jgi:excisionase family DNA binding protein
LPADLTLECAPEPGSEGGAKWICDHRTTLLIDAKAACEILAIGRRTLWSLSASNAIPSHHIGRARRYSPAELKTWVRLGCPTAPGSAERVRAAMRKGGAR